MSISVALSNALSGLTASSRMASVVSSNISNALNEGYARRTLEISPRAYPEGGGVRVDGVRRHADAALIQERRGAISAQSEADTFTAYAKRVERLFGTPEDAHSLSAIFARFEAALVASASRPELPERQASLLNAAQGVVTQFDTLEKGIQGLRGEADAEIGAAVTRINELLAQVGELNDAVLSTRARGGDTSGVEDLRQAAIDELSEIVPVRIMPRDGGAVALITPRGGILLDGPPTTLEFTRTNTITAHMTLGAALLSGIDIAGNPIDTGPNGPLAGGRLAALFTIRDDLAITAQSQLDAAARDLVDRFQDAGIDTTRALGDPGLFTDNGAAFLPADEVGLAGRLAINAQVDPDAGGALWRLRDGLGAAVPGPAGEAGLLQDLHGALTALRIPASGDFGTAGISVGGIASTILSNLGNDRRLSEDHLTFTTARRVEIEERYLSDGVDTDHEMQRLLMIEQNYAANARMIQTIDEMMNILLRI